MEKNIINFSIDENRNLFLFELDGKVATLASELMSFEGYKDVRKAWHNIKTREEFEEGFEYISLSDDNLKIFKKSILEGNDSPSLVANLATTLKQQYWRVPTLDIVLEEGIFGVMHYSNSGHANRFKKFMRREVNPQLSKEGKFDRVENEIMRTEDIHERTLKMKIKMYEDVLKVDSADLVAINQLNTCKLELNQYLNDKRIEEVNNKVDEISHKISKTTVLREGDMSAESIARKFNVFSLTHKPHIRFAENLARDLGFYKTPKGAAGYQDDCISINLTEKGGQTVSEIKYSQEAFRMMKEYVDENGLNVSEPKFLTRGKNKGKFDHAYILFMDDRKIKINEATYNLYS